jgi:hypothetical protein
MSGRMRLPALGVVWAVGPVAADGGRFFRPWGTACSFFRQWGTHSEGDGPKFVVAVPPHPKNAIAARRSGVRRPPGEPSATVRFGDPMPP